jgi:sigma-B regulation protein RsbU (phosphoserine phosphatase)
MSLPVEQLQDFFTSPAWLRVVLAALLFFYVLQLKVRPPRFFAIAAIPLLLILRDIVLHWFPHHALLIFSEAFILSLYVLWIAAYRRRLFGYIHLAVAVSASGIVAYVRITGDDALLWQVIHGVLLVGSYLYLFMQMYQVSRANSAGGEFVEEVRSGFITFYGYLLAAVLLVPFQWLAQQAVILPLTYAFHAFVFWSFHQEAQRRSTLSFDFIRKHLYSTFDFIKTLNEALSENTAVQQVTNFVSRSVMDSTYADGAVVLLINPETKKLDFSSVEGYYPPPYEIPEIVTQRIGKVQAYLQSTSIELGETLLGEVAKSRRPLFIPQGENDPRLQWQNSNRYTFASSLIAVPLIASNHLYGVLSVAKRNPGDWFTKEDYDMCGVFADYSAMTLETLYNYSELIEKREIEREVGFAANIQRDLLPARLPSISGVDIAADSYPARGVSGDYYDVLPLKKIGKVGILVCDVAGKGIPASLVMVMIRTILHVIAGASSNASKVVRLINRSVAGNVSVDRFATLAYIMLNPSTGELEMSNAAHHPLLIYRAESGSFESVDTEGLPIGMERSTDYGIARTRLDRGDIAVMYSDGITEAMNPDNEQFGEERVKQTISANANDGQGSREILSSIFTAIVRFAGEAAQHDDQTLVVLQRK